MIARVLLFTLLVAATLAATTVAVVPSLRSKAKALFQDTDRTLLAKASGRLTLAGPDITALKVKQEGRLFIEIYKLNIVDGSLELLTKLLLPESRDAFFTFQGNATNLALGDLDADGTLEVLAPTYDDEMVARLNVYKYNPESQQFDRLKN